MAAWSPSEGGHGARCIGFTGLWLAGNEGMETKMETTIMSYIRTTRRIHSFIPSVPKASVECLERKASFTLWLKGFGC